MLFVGVAPLRRDLVVAVRCREDERSEKLLGGLALDRPRAEGSYFMVRTQKNEWLLNAFNPATSWLLNLDVTTITKSYHSYSLVQLLPVTTVILKVT